MISLIGNKNCNRCNMIKTILDNKKIEYDYYILDDLSNEVQSKILEIAQSNGIMNFPLVFVDKEIKDVKEIM